MKEKELTREFSLKAKLLDLNLGKRAVLLHEKDAKKMGIHTRDRLRIWGGGNVMTAIAFTTCCLLQEGQVGLLTYAQEVLHVKEDSKIVITPLERPDSLKYIRKKLVGGTLTLEEMQAIVRDISEYRCTDVELSAFVSAVTANGFDMDEIEFFTKSMVEFGKKLELNTGKIFDKHSIGGVPGDKTTLLVVPIVAAAGLTIPKTSSRAITSCAGTADVMECICDTTFSKDDIAEIVRKTNGCLVWGGAMDLMPADSILIDVERPLNVDPEGLILASVLGKKMAVGTNFVVIDLATGKGCKVETSEEARKLAIKFIELGQRLGMHVECAITFGGQPIGRAIGPALEAKEALQAMEGVKIGSLTEKATSLAGILLELGNAATPGSGKEMAENILKEGKALEKFREIVHAQGGKKDISSEDIELAEFSVDVTSTRDGYATIIRNSVLNKIGRLAGAPSDKKAGVYLHKKKGERVRVGETLLTIYSSSESDLETAKQYAQSEQPIAVEGMLLHRVNVV